MAALLILATLAVADRVDKKRERKRAHDESRYRALQAETTRRLSASSSSTASPGSASPGGDGEVRTSREEAKRDGEKAEIEVEEERYRRDAEERRRRRKKWGRALRLGK